VKYDLTLELLCANGIDLSNHELLPLHIRADSQYMMASRRPSLLSSAGIFYLLAVEEKHSLLTNKSPRLMRPIAATGDRIDMGPTAVAELASVSDRRFLEIDSACAWRQKIRREIRDRALLVPLISANTAVRSEGYFRLEWSLAEGRRSGRFLRLHSESAGPFSQQKGPI
jgi:hypothetical protein